MKKIYQVLVGSRGYGCETPDSDWDLMGVAVEPESAVLGFDIFEQEKSTFENGEETVYGLKKFLNLVMKGSPNATELLWATNSHELSPYSAELRSLRPSIISKRTLNAYAAYMDNQMKKMRTGRGQTGYTRPELVEKYGYDTKFAYHIIRLGLMGQVLGQTGRLYMPLDKGHVEMLKEIRVGGWDLDRLFQSAQTMKEGIEHYIKWSSLPDAPDRAKIQDWLIDVYKREYGTRIKPEEV